MRAQGGLAALVGAGSGVTAAVRAPVLGTVALRLMPAGGTLLTPGRILLGLTTRAAFITAAMTAMTSSWLMR